MVVLRLTRPVPPGYECEIENEDIALEGARFVRPCERYNEFYNSCKSLGGRLHQYYVYGELLDCSAHKENHRACLDYRKTRDFDKLKRVIDWEKNFMETRIMAERSNRTWQFRAKPPADFDSPLPDFLARRQASSTLRGDE